MFLIKSAFFWQKSFVLVSQFAWNNNSLDLYFSLLGQYKMLMSSSYLLTLVWFYLERCCNNPVIRLSKYISWKCAIKGRKIMKSWFAGLSNNFTGIFHFVSLWEMCCNFQRSSCVFLKILWKCHLRLRSQLRHPNRLWVLRFIILTL